MNLQTADELMDALKSLSWVSTGQSSGGAEQPSLQLRTVAGHYYTYLKPDTYGLGLAQSILAPFAGERFHGGWIVINGISPWDTPERELLATVVTAAGVEAPQWQAMRYRLEPGDETAAGAILGLCLQGRWDFFCLLDVTQVVIVGDSDERLDISFAREGEETKELRVALVTLGFTSAQDEPQ